MMLHHWKVSLIKGNRVTREWSVWGSTLSIGSDPKSKIILPPPFATKAVEVHQNGQYSVTNEAGASRSGSVNLQDAVRFELDGWSFDIVDNTPFKMAMWTKARERMALAAKLGWREPGESQNKLRYGVLGALALLSILGMSGMVFLDHKPKVANNELPDVIVALVPEEQKEEEKEEEKPEPKEDAGGASDEEPKNPNEGGATEARTVAWPPSTPSAVMQNSVMDKISAMSDGLLGEDVDPNEANMIDVILAGGGGSMKKGERGGRGAGGDGDRMAGVGGIGLGTGGRAGFGTGNGGTRKGNMALGAGGTGKGMSTRARIAPPKPSDVELGGEAGSRSPESILRVIRQHIGGFQYTYQKYLRDNPGLGGKISLKFTIAPSGDIIAISVVASNTGNGGLDDEIKDKARRMKFDQIEKGNVTVTYAFVLDRQ
jgi:TonB family protein